MTCFHIPYLILSHVPFLLSYLYLLSVISVFHVVSGCGQIGRISCAMATLETGQDPPYEASEHREDTSQHHEDTSQHREDTSQHREDTSQHREDTSQHREDTSQHRRETSQRRRETSKLVGTRRNS